MYVCVCSLNVHVHVHCIHGYACACVHVYSVHGYACACCMHRHAVSYLHRLDIKVGMLFPEKGLVHDYRLEDGGLIKMGKEDEEAGDEEKKSKQQKVH